MPYIQNVNVNAVIVELVLTCKFSNSVIRTTNIDSNKPSKGRPGNVMIISVNIDNDGLLNCEVCLQKLILFSGVTIARAIKTIAMFFK
mgnify:CR=1 FL=1|jgi:hypothetical protein